MTETKHIGLIDVIRGSLGVQIVLFTCVLIAADATVAVFYHPDGFWVNFGIWAGFTAVSAAVATVLNWSAVR